MPALNFKTVQGKQFNLEFDDSVKVIAGVAARRGVEGGGWGAGHRGLALGVPSRLLAPCEGGARRGGWRADGGARPPQIADVKAKIEETQGPDFPADKMNIIYQGKGGGGGGGGVAQGW